jgi:hypothetical protein
MNGRREGGSIAAGFAALRSGGNLVLLLTAVTVVLAVLATAPLGPSLSDAFARTLAGDHVVRNHPMFAPTDVFDFFQEKRPAISGVNAAGKWAALIALLQQILFAGGIVSVLGRGGPVAIPEFVAAVRRNSWHNLKCFLIFLLLGGISLAVWLGAQHAVYKKVFEDLAPGSPSTLFFRILVAVVSLLLYAFFSLLHDFARAARRSLPRIGAWRAYGHARRTLSGRWPRTLGIFLFWFLLGGAVLLAGIAVEWSAPAVTALAITVHILLQILVLAIRPVFRIATWGSYLALYDAAQPAPVPAETPAPLPSEPGPPPLPTLEEHPLI